ncbi:hypothetical protein GMORB2_1662 [Geosmithia morbida]|uniref:Uncharacterized protein n=1 Tax=Geosmithia morbida TaxID=1094350 RepID=A0A9P4YU28_9HYPO|nr:uncharacterized protein GMORB2_1662 [Geosmithia morbida]KAF4121822.1 hypothetical protein GMORB2_1662 [Geosmithia morbida]
MTRSSRAPTVAFMEEADEDSGSSVEIRAGTRVYALSEDQPSPPKERPNTGKYRRGEGPNSPPRGTKERGESRKERDPRPYRDQGREIAHHERRDSESAARRMRAEAKADRDSAKALKNSRPQSLRHANTQPAVQQPPPYRRPHADAPGVYGGPPPQRAPSRSRPRAASRPANHYDGQMGPLPPVTGGWAASPMGPPPLFPSSGPGPYDFEYSQSPYSQSPMLGGAHMAAAMHGGMLSGSPGGPGFYEMAPPPPQGPPPVTRDLRQRFEPRPSSAMGYSSTASRSYRHDDYPDYPDYPEEAPYGSTGGGGGGHQRRPSRTQRQQKDDDRKRMPPPDLKPQRIPSMPRRPSTTANTVTPFQPPPQRPSSRHQTRPPPPSHRRSVGFTDPDLLDEEDDEDDDDDEDNLLTHEDLFHDSPEPSYHQRRRSVHRPQRGSFAVYDDDDHDSQPLARRRSRRGSTYGGAALGTGGVSLTEENKYMDAVRYQEDVSGGPQMPLTAESLRKANKRGEGVASSRSTRSSASRDDSEYKRSNTTGLTRSSNGNNDDFTIKVSGAAVVRVNGAEIQCENSEITFSNGMATRAGDLDGGSALYELEDDRSLHRERKALPHRPRAPSQGDSQSRGYLPGYAPYEPYDGGLPSHASYI